MLDGGAFYVSEGGGVLFHPWADTWEGHYLLLDRGKAARDLALGILARFMLDVRPKLLWGRVAVSNRPARLFTRRLGFTSLGVRTGIPPRPDLEFEIFALGAAWDSFRTSSVE